MNHHYKGKAKKILAWLAALLLIVITVYSNGSGIHRSFFHISLTRDTIPPKKKNTKKQQFPSTVVKKVQDSLKNKSLPASDSAALILKKAAEIMGASGLDSSVKILNDTIKKKSDSSKVSFSDTVLIPKSKDSLDAPVSYHADDSLLLDVPGKKMILYGKVSRVKYSDNDLSAPVIEYDQKTNLVRAFLKKDSTGKVISYPEYVQGDFKTKSDTIEFNMKNGKGITKGTYTQQGEMYVYGETIKKVDKEVFYASKARFTTCNLDTPHFAFVSNKIKFVSKKMAYSGPVHPEFEGVPLPIYLPFGIYPMSQGRHSGFIMGSFSANDQMGISLEGLGYYKIINQTWDIVTRGTIYSYGGWSADINPRYFKRYRYEGNFSLYLQNSKLNFKGDPDYSSTRTYKLRWSHNANTKARPGVTFTGSVEAGSSKFNSRVPNSPYTNFTNQMSSSINYAKVWKNKPYNISIGANHNQNTVTGLININLPNIAFNVNTQYPFRRKEVVGELKWYENIGIALNSNVQSLSSFYDTAGNISKQLSNRWQWAARHSIPISLSLPPVGNVQITPSVSYEERWYQQKLIRSWNVANKKLDSNINKGFYTARDMNFGVSFLTRIFGLYTFRKNAKFQAIRHELRPTISINYKPDFTGSTYYSTQVDTLNRIARYSRYDGNIFGPYSEGKFGGLNFELDNIVQAKVRNRKDTGENAIKKISLLDGLSIRASYNFMVDSFQLSPIGISARTNLFNKINITANANFDPYLSNSIGQRINKLVWSKKAFTLGSLTNGNVSMSSSFRGGDKSKQTTNTALDNINQIAYNNGIPLDEAQQEALYMQNNPGEYADFSIPWDVSFSYSLRFNRVLNSDYRYITDFNQDISWNGSLNLTPKWKIGLSGFYNITDKQLGTISMFLSREMHCWQMSINISPVGTYKFFTINISPKSNILRDLKVNRTRYFYDL